MRSAVVATYELRSIAAMGKPEQYISGVPQSSTYTGVPIRQGGPDMHSLKTTEVRSRIEPEVKKNATKVLADCGLDLSGAIRLFLRQVVAQQGLPFEVRVPNATTIAAMEEARTITAARFNSAQELFDDLEGKAGRAKKSRARTKRR